MSYSDLIERIRGGGVALLDGGTGTELERRGVAMSPQAWCALADRADLEVLGEVHRDYVDCGADVITTNSYASSRLMLEAAGLGHRTRDINLRTDEVAVRVREQAARPIWVAGSVSHMVPQRDGVPLLGQDDHARIYDAAKEIVGIHEESGCDFLLLEMMYDVERIPPLLRAASESPLPVWVGTSARRAAGGALVGHQLSVDTPFEQVAATLEGIAADVAGVMHSASDVTSEALGVVRRHHDGPLLAYPDSGYFKMPHWQFEDIIAPVDFARYAGQWVGEGVAAVGGCCGLGPEHIRAIAHLRRPAGAR